MQLPCRVQRAPQHHPDDRAGQAVADGDRPHTGDLRDQRPLAALLDQCRLPVTGRQRGGQDVDRHRGRRLRGEVGASARAPANSRPRRSGRPRGARRRRVPRVRPREARPRDAARCPDAGDVESVGRHVATVAEPARLVHLLARNDAHAPAELACARDQRLGDPAQHRRLIGWRAERRGLALDAPDDVGRRQFGGTEERCAQVDQHWASYGLGRLNRGHHGPSAVGSGRLACYDGALIGVGVAEGARPARRTAQPGTG